MADRRQRIHRWVRLALLVGVAVEGGILYGGTLYPWLFYVGIVGGLALAGLTVWDALSNYAKDVAVCRLAAETCSVLMNDADDLWRRIETGRVEDADIEATLSYIRRWWNHATQRVDLEVDHALNLPSAEAAHAEVVNRYDPWRRDARQQTVAEQPRQQQAEPPAEHWRGNYHLPRPNPRPQPPPRPSR